jgi:hypothetical protein
MSISTLATVFGVVFLLAGISGVFAAPPPPDALPLAVNHGHGLALGLLPVNTLHNAVHLLFGVVGLLAARGILLSARAYFQSVAVIYGVLTVMGIMPATQTAFGLVPIYGNDVWLHAVIAVAAAFIGFAMPARATAAMH